MSDTEADPLRTEGVSCKSRVGCQDCATASACHTVKRLLMRNVVPDDSELSSDRTNEIRRPLHQAVCSFFISGPRVCYAGYALSTPNLRKRVLLKVPHSTISALFSIQKAPRQLLSFVLMRSEEGFQCNSYQAAQLCRSKAFHFRAAVAVAF